MDGKNEHVASPFGDILNSFAFEGRRAAALAEMDQRRTPADVDADLDAKELAGYVEFNEVEEDEDDDE